VPPQHEADDDAKREGRGKRGDRAIRDQFFDMILFCAQGLAELAQGALDLVDKRVGAGLGCIEMTFGCGIQQRRYVDLERLELVSQSA
jgi:hypothetical protein